MKIKQWFALSAVISSILLLAACGSNSGSGGDQTAGKTPVQIITEAAFVGSTKCLSCHGDKSNWGHTLHKAVLRAPNTFSPAQARTETFYADTINHGIQLSLGTADGGLDDAGTPDGEFVGYYSDGTSWKTHYELGFGDTADIASLPATDGGGTFEKKYAAQVIMVGTDYYIEFTNLVAVETAQYQIMFTYGGERNYKQRYVLTGAMLGASKHISPLQYNDKWAGYVDPINPTTPDLNYKWVNYHAERWYDLGDDELAMPGSKDSFDGNCAGCHFTGYTIAKNGGGEEYADAVDDINGAVDFDGDGSMDEINIGCEACHGAGSEHASTQNPAYIVNPADLEPTQANMVCGQCHIRGKSVDSFVEFAEATVDAPARAPFPAKLDANGNLMKFRPGIDDLADFYSFDSGAGDFDGQYWATEPSGGDYVASSSHHQQYIDMLQGPHAENGMSYDPTCFSCHDSHDNGSVGRHQIVTTVTEDNTVVKTANDDNSLCLACHAGFGIFADITVEDVTQINANSAFNSIMDPVQAAVTAHTQHYYDPTNLDDSNGSSRCSKCHMPKTAKSALRYDIHAHTFEIIQPTASMSMAATDGVPNSCNACHETNNDDVALGALQDAYEAKFAATPTNTYFNQWATSGHADTTGEALNHWNEDGSISTSCAKCHAKDGFIDFADDGSVDMAARLGTTISCGACHTNGDNAMLFTDPVTRYATQVATVGTGSLEAIVFPSGDIANLSDDSNMCMACHQGRSSKLTVDAATAGSDGTFRFTNIHYFAAAASFFGTDVQGGFEYTGQTYDGEMVFPGAHGGAGYTTCVGCHMGGSEGPDNHNFMPQVSDCSGCHTVGAGGAFVDLGIGVSTSNTEIQNLKAQLLSILEAGGVVPLSGYPYFSNITTKALLQGAYNWQVADKDPGGYIHNPNYIRQILFDSITDLGGTPVAVRP